MLILGNGAKFNMIRCLKVYHWLKMYIIKLKFQDNYIDEFKADTLFHSNTVCLMKIDYVCPGALTLDIFRTSFGYHFYI